MSHPAFAEEVFGPVLHFVRYRREELDGLVGQINGTGYGLTMGLHTRIDETIAHVLDAALAQLRTPDFLLTAALLAQAQATDTRLNSDIDIAAAAFEALPSKRRDPVAECHRNPGEALRAAEKLAGEGLSVGVLNLHTIKPIDTQALQKAAARTGRILTVEDHGVVGGLEGEMVAAGELAGGFGTIPGRDEEFVVPEMAVGAAAKRDAEHLEHRLVEGAAGGEVGDDQLDMVDQATAVELHRFHDCRNLQARIWFRGRN